MENLILKPLAEEYETLYIRTTELEKFKKCPRRYKDEPYKESDAQAFGTYAHEMLTTYLYNKDRERYDWCYDYFVAPEHDKHKHKWLSEYLTLADDIPELFIAEKRFSINIECGKYLVVLSGGIDCVHIDGSLSDIKTSKNKRSEGEEFYRRQPRIYSYMYRRSVGVTEGVKDFWFHIFSKHKRDACRLDSRKVEIDLKKAEADIAGLVKEYVVAHHTNIWEEKEQLRCKACELYKTNMCKLHNPLLRKYNND